MSDLRPGPDDFAALERPLSLLREGFEDLPAESDGSDAAAIERVLMEVAARLHDNPPFFHPQYAGQMLKPPHAVARLAYALAMTVNPNNHALDGGPASSRMEQEAVAALARMFGWSESLGHLTAGGTMANLEALWVAGRLRPGETVLASSQAHYTHGRISSVLQLPFEPVACDAAGRMDVAALERRLAAGGVGAVVATMGTTAIGSVDPLPEILALRDRFGFRIHADAAYGGYFTLAANLGAEAARAFAGLSAADSIVVDPHKHGLQPYGCGAVLFRDPAVAGFYKHDSPYTYFSSGDLHLGEITLECSRAGAAAVALWATQRLFPLERGGAFAQRLEASRAAAIEWHARLAADSRFIAPLAPELDIVVWAVRAPRASESSERARRVFESAARHGLHLALAALPAALFARVADFETDRDTVTCLRSVLMKPEHLGWTERLWALLDRAMETGNPG